MPCVRVALIERRNSSTSRSISSRRFAMPCRSWLIIVIEMVTSGRRRVTRSILFLSLTTCHLSLPLILLQLFDVALKVSLHLPEAIAAELLQRGVGKHYREHGFADYSGCRDSHYI